MRYSDYKLLMQLNGSVVAALKQSISNSDNKLYRECINSLELIKQAISGDTDSADSAELLSLADKLIAMLADECQHDDIISAAKHFADMCEDKITYKIRVLFVAELGGKWDAMASVYKAMSERNDVQVDVVLQPVFRIQKQPDGTERSNLVYDDFLTPLGIKHIPYKEYDMKRIRPDMTFFSQPYEGCTDSMFWPENMAKYTRVVYLPYFAAITMNTISSAFMSFFRLNTQKYSWRIACQSDVMKKLYEKNASQKGKNAIVTGIPKWDYPINLNKTNTPIPKQWKEKLQGRKVFLWNTHFSADSCGSQLFTDKTIQFLNMFLSNKDKIALIWRPHPMLESVIKVYYSKEAWEYYLDLKRQIKKSPNMVIDDHPTYDRAFVWSDALISDFSTLMDQYIFMHKPVLMLTNDDIETARNKLSKSELCDYSILPFANTLDMEKEFIENICNGKGKEYVERQDTIIQNYFKLADGKCGERVAERVIEDFKKEAMSPGRNTDIIIFGTIKESEPCINLLKENNTDHYLCDLFISTEEAKNYPTLSLDELDNFNYKCIVVTNKESFNMIRNILIEEHNVPDEKILDFWMYYNMFIPKMLCDKKMLDPRTSEYSGLILGISHTEVGLLEDKFRKPFCNLSISSQDLFYQYNTLKYIYENYPHKIKNLEYAIVDLYDYNYFNYDTSMFKNIINYWLWGGYSLKPHNFENNKSFAEDYDTVFKKLTASYYVGGKEKLLKIWSEYFTNIYNYTDFKGFDGRFSISNRMGIVTDEQINNYEYNRATVTKIHDNTIEENKQIFVKILEFLKKINPNIKIYTIVIPKYIETEKRDKKLLSVHEKYFNEIIAEIGSKYQFTHLDLKSLPNLSNKRDFYYDAAHLNYYGAYTLTKMIDSLIFDQ